MRSAVECGALTWSAVECVAYMRSSHKIVTPIPRQALSAIIRGDFTLPGKIKGNATEPKSGLVANSWELLRFHFSSGD